MPSSKSGPKTQAKPKLKLNLDPSRRYVISVSDQFHTFTLKHPRPVYLVKARLRHSPETRASAVLGMVQAIPISPYRSFLTRTLLNAISLALAVTALAVLFAAADFVFGTTHRTTPKQDTATKSVKA